MDNQLAIIIPFAKAHYFEATLKSLLDQTNHNFNLYIGVDGVPFDLHSSLKPFEERGIKVTLKHFAENIGQTALTQQWERCIALSNEERWIWLFSDDDLLDQACVAAFYQSLADTNERYDLYRFNTKSIDADGHIINYSPPHPAEEGSWDFCYHLLMGTRKSTAVEYLFSRKIYEQCRGFVSFPQAWGSDWCTWISFGTQTGIRLIPGAKVAHRSSAHNISNSHHLVTQKIYALFQYCEWVQKEYAQQIADPFSRTAKEMKEALEIHFLQALALHPPIPVIRQAKAAAQTASQLFGRPMIYYLWKIVAKATKSLLHNQLKRLP